MFSGTRTHHGTAAYSFGQHYGYSNGSCPQYTTDPMATDMAYQTSIAVSWPTMYTSNSGCARQYEEWMQPATNCGGGRGPATIQHSYNYSPNYHLQRNNSNNNNESVHCAMNATGILMPDMDAADNAGPDGQTSPAASIAAVSSDGLSGSESPGISSTMNGLSRPQPARSPFEWMKKTSYQSQPNPGKTRTKDKYRVVYTDHQRLELEKEFHYSHYITIRRKSELAALLGLSERQVKIWFQNRRAKERKQAKKKDEMLQKHKDDPLMHHHHHHPAASMAATLNFFKPILCESDI